MVKKYYYNSGELSSRKCLNICYCCCCCISIERRDFHHLNSFGKYFPFLLIFFFPPVSFSFWLLYVWQFFFIFLSQTEVCNTANATGKKVTRFYRLQMKKKKTSERFMYFFFEVNFPEKEKFGMVLNVKTTECKEKDRM